MTGAPYDKAVEAFEALIDAPRSAAHSKPAHLIAATGQSTSSGYRAIAAMEAEAFLRRDSKGAYLLGTAGLRVACSACGLGHLAPVLPPLLRRLRDNTQRTAFAAFLSGTEVMIGPFLTGRMSRNIRLGSFYRLEQALTLSDGTVRDVTLTSQASDIVHRVQTGLIGIATSASHTAVLGLLLKPGEQLAAPLLNALTSAASEIAP